MQKQPSNLSPITTTNMITTTAAIRTASMQRLLHRYAKSSSAGNIQQREPTFQRVANRGPRIEPPSAPKKKQHRSNLVLLNHPSHVVPSELFGRDDLQSKFDVYDCANMFC